MSGREVFQWDGALPTVPPPPRLSGMTEAGVDGSDHVLPHWPTEVHYTGTGYGA